VVLAALVLAAACNGALRFDDHAVDGASQGCSGGNCGWYTETCDAALCPLDCAENKTCSGSCGPLCTATCSGMASCTLTSGEGANLTCADRATCTFQVAEETTVSCEGSANCTVHCLSSCSVTCDSGATCQLQCGSAAPGVIVTAGSCAQIGP
jgi:hypothetical protein